MRVYLFDLDDTLVQTVEHACRVLYPAVATKLRVPCPSPQRIREMWGQPLEQALPALFAGASAEDALLALREAHTADPPPPFTGVVRMLRELLRAGCVVRIFSAGDPAIVRNTVQRSLELNPDEAGRIYSLTKGRRLRAVDVDIMLDGIPASDNPSPILIFSDTPGDRQPAFGDPDVLFYGLTSGVADRQAHERAGTPPAMIFESVADALDAIGDHHAFAGEVEQSEYIAQLQKAVAGREIVVFLGAGVSVDSGLPTAADLAKRFGQASDSLQRVMTALSSDPATYSELHRLISDPSHRPNRIHRALALLDAPYYIGTNWDHLLERAFAELYGDSYSDDIGVASVDAHLPSLTGKRNAYIKLHGDIDRKDSLVADVPSYASRISRPNLLDKLVEVLLNSSKVLFVGYSVSDMNVIAQLIEHRLWEGAAPPPRFAILHDVSPTDAKFLRASGIYVIDTEATGADHGRRTFSILARLYDAKEDFASDAQLMAGHPELGPIELFYRALTHYQESQFSRAIEALDGMREKVLDWRQHLPLLARYSYLTVKVYDKLERWDQLVNIDELYLKDQFRRVQPVMPGTMFDWMLGHYQSSLALAALRAAEPERALSLVERSIDAARRQPFAARMLLADRRVVRAIILQYLSKMGKPTDESWIDDLYFARLTYERHGGLGGDREVHFAGRYYGAAVFLTLTYPDLDDADHRRVFGDLDVMAAARRSHAMEQRLPYGIVAGEYCEAYLRYRLLRAGHVDAADATTVSLLEHTLTDVEIGSLTRLKRSGLAQRLRAALAGNEQEESPEMIEARAAGGPYLRKHIDNLTFNGWLGTPLN